MSIDRRILAWLLACGLLPVMTTAILSPSLAGLHEEFQAEAQVDVFAKLVLTSPALAIALGAGAVGILLDRLGRLPILGLSLLGFAVFGCYGYWAEELTHLIAGRFLFGFAVAGIMTTTATLLADVSEGRELRRVLGLQAALMGVWGITAQTIAGWMAEWHWRGPFLLYSISLPLLVWMLFLHNIRVSAPQSSPGEETPTYASSRRMMALVILLSVVAMSLFSLVPVHGPLFFKQVLHRGPRGTAFLISSLTAASSLSSLSLAVWRRHMRTEHLILLGFFSITASCLLMGMVPQFWVVWIAMLAMGMGIGLVVPCLQSWTAQRVGASGRGRALGFLTSANYIGQFLCPFWAHYFLARGGHLTLFQACTWIGAFFTLGVGVMAWIRAWPDEGLTLAQGVAVPSVQELRSETPSDEIGKKSS